MTAQVDPKLTKSELWKSSFEKFKSLINNHVPIARLDDENSSAIFINEDELLSKDAEAQTSIQSKDIHVNSAPQVQTNTPVNQATRQEKSSVQMKKPVEPQKPDPDDCCGDGCRVCVWDRYYMALEKYEEELEKWKKIPAEEGAGGDESPKETRRNGISRDQNLSALDW